MLSNTSTVRVFASGNTRIAEPEHTYRPTILRTLRATTIAIDTKKRRRVARLRRLGKTVGNARSRGGLMMTYRYFFLPLLFFCGLLSFCLPSF
jgi:hypothetical protein